MRTKIVAVATAVLALANPSPSAERQAPHDVTLHVESLTSTPVAFHVTRRAAASSRTDAPVKTLGETSHTTPADVTIGADATEVEIVTQHNEGVRVTFQAGGSERERKQKIWGRQILLRNDGSDLMVEPRSLNIVPATSE
jgi:hypothetical protein